MGSATLDIRIRLARADERAALEALQRRASMHAPDYRQALSDHPDAIDLPLEQITGGRALVAEVDGAVAGFAVTLPRPDGGAELDGLFVEPELWKGGIGRALVEAAARQAHAESARTLHVIANPTALGFYRRCGFEDAGMTETRFGRAPLMTRTLSTPGA